MDYARIAGEVAGAMVSGRGRRAGFDPRLVGEAKALREKGYTHIVQIEVRDEDGATRPFGEPLFVKGADAAGPLLRSFPSYANARVRWTYPIEAVVAEGE